MALDSPQPVVLGLAPGLTKLSARQTQGGPTNISAECQPDCAAYTKVQDCGTDENCICTDAVVDALVSCENCLLSFNNTQVNRDFAQSGIDFFVNACKQAGFDVKTAKVSGQRNGVLALRPELLGVVSIAAGAMLLLL